MIRKLFYLLIIGALAAATYQYWGPWFQENALTAVSNPSDYSDRQVKAKFAVLSDTHSDAFNTRKALNQAKSLGASYILNTGDLTKVGTDEELRQAKADFDSVGLSYYLVPGDHDLYAASGTGLFEQIIGRPYYSFDRDGLHFIMMDTSDTAVGINSSQMAWLSRDIAAHHDQGIVVFMHLPIFHPTSPRTIWEKGGNNDRVKDQAEQVLRLFQNKDILATFAGDHHYSSSYTEPNSNVKMYIVGATTGERNLQKPRFDMVTVYEDNSVRVEEIIIR